MENFINSIGGLNSWQFASLACGSLIVGTVLFAWKTYLIPVLYFGNFLLFLYVSDAANKAAIATPEMAGAISIVPILFFVVVIIIPFATKNHIHKTQRSNEPVAPH